MPSGMGVSDPELLTIVGDSEPLAVSDMVTALGVTRTAVRERLLRLMAVGLVERQLFRGGRGRPTYRYSLSAKARKLAGNNFADLAVVLWHQVVGVQDAELRRSLERRIVSALKAIYENEVHGTTIKERMESLRELLASRRIRCQVDQGDALPTITLRDCPYLELAQVDCTICEMETMLFSELLGDDLLLTECRLDGHSCCKFGPSPKRGTGGRQSIA